MSELKFETVFQAGMRKAEETKDQELLDLRTKYAEALAVITYYADAEQYCYEDRINGVDRIICDTVPDGLAIEFLAKHESDESGE